MPSFTFTSTANAIALRGGVPVFVDIRKDTLNIDENRIEQAITAKTKAIFVVHYAGVSCEMDAIQRIAKKYKLFLLEDAAQGFLSTYKGKYLGTLGDLGAYSFHETKNVISGEGGALLVNNKKFVERAEIIREKGTNRSNFFRGLVSKYTWVDIGSSYLPSEIIAAFLFAQLEQMYELTKKRLEIWDIYHTAFEELELKGLLRRPIIPIECVHNAHMYYILLNNLETRTRLIETLNEYGIMSVFHYVPLHSSPAGKKFARYSNSMTVTNKISNTLLRLPLFCTLSKKEVAIIINIVKNAIIWTSERILF
jgi:dTDP-4-amino-4,6-dideoxygalactose transaminase